MYSERNTFCKSFMKLFFKKWNLQFYTKNWGIVSWKEVVSYDIVKSFTSIFLKIWLLTGFRQLFITMKTIRLQNSEAFSANTEKLYFKRYHCSENVFERNTSSFSLLSASTARWVHYNDVRYDYREYFVRTTKHFPQYYVKQYVKEAGSCNFYKNDGDIWYW